MRSPPAPSAPLIGDTHIPLRLLHSSRAFSRGHPYVAPATPTPPAPAALLPRPHRGRGPCPGVYQESSRIRGGAGGKSVSGSFPPIPWHWTVGISPRGVGLTGRGNSFPLPCLLRSQNSEYLTDPVRVPCRWVPKELAGDPHPARAFASRLPIRFCRRPPPRLSRRRCRGRGCGQPPGMIPAPDGWSGRVPRPSHRSKSRGR